MMRNLLIHLLVQFMALSIVCSSATLIGMISSGGLGGTAIGVAPEFTFGLVERFVCPDDTRLEYTSVRRSYHQPGESEPHVECVAPDGARQEVLAPAMLSVFGLVFLTTFVTVFLATGVPLAIASYIIVRAMLKRTGRRGQAPLS